MTIVYKIMLTAEGYWLVDLGEDTWEMTESIDDATAFKTHGLAQAYLNEMDIKFMFPQASVQSVGI